MKNRVAIAIGGCLFVLAILVIVLADIIESGFDPVMITASIISMITIIGVFTAKLLKKDN